MRLSRDFPLNGEIAQLIRSKCYDAVALLFPLLLRAWNPDEPVAVESIATLTCAIGIDDARRTREAAHTLERQNLISCVKRTAPEFLRYTIKPGILATAQDPAYFLTATLLSVWPVLATRERSVLWSVAATTYWTDYDVSDQVVPKVVGDWIAENSGWMQAEYNQQCEWSHSTDGVTRDPAHFALRTSELQLMDVCVSSGYKPKDVIESVCILTEICHGSLLKAIRTGDSIWCHLPAALWSVQSRDKNWSVADV